MRTKLSQITRRRFLQGATALTLLSGLQSLVPVYARRRLAHAADMGPDGETEINLAIRKQYITISGHEATAVTVNGTMPGPLLRFREGGTAVIRVTNHLAEDTSIHWHGIILPANMDGVPGVSFNGIKPGETFTYRFPLVQSGTYWYHSHSGLQEQSGLFGPLLIDPAEEEPVPYDREYIVMLSDWTFDDPHKILANLKKVAGYYNFQKRTIADLFRDATRNGWKATLADRIEWGRMRMDPTDIADVTGYAYTYLLNGLPPAANWTGLFNPGERVRLRFINAGAGTYFDVRIPGLEMTVIQADGQNVQPVTVDELRIAIAETYDVIVVPREEQAYTIFAETMDRSGFASGILAPRPGMSAPLPQRRPRPILTMADMGMTTDHGMGEMGEMGSSDQGRAMTGAAASSHGDMPGMPGMEHGGDEAGGDRPVMHGPDHHGPGNSMVAMMSRRRTHERGLGLEDAPWRVLVYGDLRSLHLLPDQRPPGREIELHLTGNMERYMWSFDGKKFSEAEPIRFILGERLRLTLVNDTMMEHPIHLHGMWMELDNGTGPQRPRKHTVSVKPAERLSVDITADAPGDWAFHCHILNHMMTGMFRVVSVRPETGGVKP